MGDWTEHLCPCPSKLRWALPAGARRQLAKGGRTDRWPQRIAIPSRTILLIINILLHYDSQTPYTEPRPAPTLLLAVRRWEPSPDPGAPFQAESSASSCRRLTQPEIARRPWPRIPERSPGGGAAKAGTRPQRRPRGRDRCGRQEAAPGHPGIGSDAINPSTCF